VNTLLFCSAYPQTDLDYATGIDEDWDDVHQKYLDTKRKYTYTRT